MRSADLADLPSAVVITAGFDILRDQGEDNAIRLHEAGVAVTYRCYDSLTHAFTTMTGVVPAAKAACEEISQDIRDALHPLDRGVH